MIANKLIIGIVIFGSASIFFWSFFVAPELNTTPNMLEATAQNVGMIKFADNIGDNLSEPTKMTLDWQRKIIEQNGNRAIIRTTYDYKDIITDESYWITEFDEHVDRFSREYLDKPGHFMFPNNLEKKNYSVIDIGGDVLHFSYEGTEEIRGLQVYKFTAKTTFDISHLYDYFSEQIFEDYATTTYVDPVTGLEVSFFEEFTDYAIIDNQKIVVLDAYTETTKFSQFVLVNQAQQLQTLLWIHNIIIPFIIGIVTICIIFGVFFYSKLESEHVQLISIQKKLLKAEKLAGIGELSSRLAHDIRNPLTVIKSSLQILESVQNLPDVVKHRMKMMAESVDRINHQINNVLDFIKTKELKIKPNSILQIIQSSISDFNIPKNIKITTIGDDYTINCDFESMRIVFNNLIYNAIQSIGSQQGTIIVKTYDDDKHYIISVLDSGPDISDEILPKLFEPLFTTKQEGTGLGLTSVKSIIKKHNGIISVSTNPKIFTIKLQK